MIVVDTSTTAPEDPHLPTELFYDELAARTPPGPPTRETIRMEIDAQSFSKDHISADYIDRMLKIALLPSVREVQHRLVTLRPTVWFPTCMAIARGRSLKLTSAACL